MAYIIWNTTQRKWVAPASMKSSYTTSDLKARQFDTKEAAERECCGDERAVRLRA